MGADQFPHPETPKVGRSPFSVRESEGRALPHLLPEFEGHTLPHPPPGIPTGFCHEARGCTAEVLPRVKAKDINNPEGVVPMVRMGGMLCVCITGRRKLYSGRTPLPRPRTRSHSALVCRTPGGHNGKTLFGVPGRGRRPDGLLCGKWVNTPPDGDNACRILRGDGFSVTGLNLTVTRRSDRLRHWKNSICKTF